MFVKTFYPPKILKSYGYGYIFLPKSDFITHLAILARVYWCLLFFIKFWFAICRCLWRNNKVHEQDQRKWIQS